MVPAPSQRRRAAVAPGVSARLAKRQTRRLEGPVSERTSGFESRDGHAVQHHMETPAEGWRRRRPRTPVAVKRVGVRPSRSPLSTWRVSEWPAGRLLIGQDGATRRSGSNPGLSAMCSTGKRLRGCRTHDEQKDPALPVAGCSSAWKSAWFGTRKSQVQILSSRRETVKAGSRSVERAVPPKGSAREPLQECGSVWQSA